MKQCFFLFLLGVSVLCTGEQSSFLLQEVPVKRQPQAHLRQQIADLMGTILEQEAVVVEHSARIQQKLCRELRKVVEESMPAQRLKSSTRKEPLKVLQQRLSSLQLEQRRLKEHVRAQELFLKTFA